MMRNEDRNSPSTGLSNKSEVVSLYGRSSQRKTGFPGSINRGCDLVCAAEVVMGGCRLKGGEIQIVVLIHMEKDET